MRIKKFPLVVFLAVVGKIFSFTTALRINSLSPRQTTSVTGHHIVKSAYNSLALSTFRKTTLHSKQPRTNIDNNNESIETNESESVLGRFLTDIGKIAGSGSSNNVKCGDMIVAKIDVQNLGIYRDQSYEIRQIYDQGLNSESGQIEKLPVDALFTSVNGSDDNGVPRGYTRYLTLYSIIHHGVKGVFDPDDVAVIVTADEVGLVTIKQEIGDAALLAIPGFFWVVVCYLFTNYYHERYGGNFIDAFLGR